MQKFLDSKNSLIKIEKPSTVQFCTYLVNSITKNFINHELAADRGVKLSLESITCLFSSER